MTADICSGPGHDNTVLLWRVTVTSMLIIASTCKHNLSIIGLFCEDNE